MKLTFGRLWTILRETASEWIEDNAPRLGAALAYYSVFSLAPLLVVAIAAAEFFYTNAEAVRGRVEEQLTYLLNEEGAAALLAMIDQASRRGDGTLATVLGLATLVFGATGVVVILKDSLNVVWGVVADPNRPWWQTVIDRVVSLTLVLGVGFLLLVSLVLTAALSAISTWAMTWIPVPLPAAYLVNLVVSFLVITALFAMIFKVLPDVEIGWQDVWVGSAITALLFLLGKELIGLYLGKAGVGNAYGAAGSLVMILVWIYYSSLILFFGAEFTQVYARSMGTEIKPARGALPISQALLEKEQLLRKHHRQKAALVTATCSGEIAEVAAGPDSLQPSESSPFSAVHRSRPRFPVALTAFALGWILGRRND